MEFVAKSPYDSVAKSTPFVNVLTFAIVHNRLEFPIQTHD